MASTGTSTRGDRTSGTQARGAPEEDVAEAGSRPATDAGRGGSLLPFVGIASLFVIVAITLHVSATLRSTLESELGGRLRISAELAGNVLSSYGGPPPVHDATLAARLEEVRSATGVSEILFYDRGGELRGGAYSAAPHATRLPRSVLAETAGSGPLAPSPRAPERDLSGGIALLVPVAEAAGGGALLTRIDPDSQGGLPAIDFLFEVAKALAGIVTAAGLLILLRWVTGGHHFVARPAERAPGSDVGMVLGTVKEVMSTLKDREAVHRDHWTLAELDPEARRLHTERIVASIESGLVAFDNAGRVTLFNRGAERILGFAARSALGRLVTELFDEGDPIRRIVDELLGDLQTHKRIEWERARPEGGSRWLAASSSVVRDARGVPQGGLLLVDDRTERRKARETAARNDRLSAVEEMSAGIAEELRRALEALAEHGSARPGLAPLESLEATVRSVLELAEGARPVREPADVNALLLDVAGSVRDRAAAAGVQMVLELDDGLPWVPMESTSMRRAFVHCITNALDAMEPEGGGMLTIASRSTELKSDDGGSRPAVRVSFRDTGPGIPEADRHRVFTPFHSTKGDGRGLGLPLVHRTVTAHDGRLHLHSRIGVGSEFVVLLPVEEDA